jgi:hypothetical protein
MATPARFALTSAQIMEPSEICTLRAAATFSFEATAGKLSA